MNNLQELSAVTMSQDTTMIGTEVEIAGGMTMMIGIIDTGAGVMTGVSIRPISGLVSLA
jgi:hypothetical protein